MKIDILRTFIAVAIGALLGWGFSTLSHDENSALPLGIIVGTEIALLCVGMFGVSYDYARTGVMVRTTCAVGTVIVLILNSVFAYVGINTTFYVLNGITALIILLVVNAVYKSKQ